MSKRHFPQYSSFPGTTCEIPPVRYTRSPSRPSTRPSLPSRPASTPSDACRRAISRCSPRRDDATVRFRACCDFRIDCVSISVFPSLFCHLPLSKQFGVCVSPFDKVVNARCVELRIFRANRVFSRILFSGFVELPAFLQYNVKQSETKPPDKIHEPETKQLGSNPARLEN